MGKGTNKKNRGFTLIELIVVIAIIAIVAGISTYSFNYVTIHRVKAFVNDCDALLSQCKVETMSGATDVSFYIEKPDDKWVAVLKKNGNKIEKSASKSKNFTCYAEITNTLGTKNTIEIKAIKLSFDRSTGQMNLQSYKDQYGREFNVADVAGIQCTKITVSNAVGSKSIILIPQTGYHEVE